MSRSIVAIGLTVLACIGQAPTTRDQADREPVPAALQGDTRYRERG